MSGLVIDGFAGPGGWSEGLRMLGLTDVGIELDDAACRTRAAAGHPTICADITAFPVEQLAGKVRGWVGSPECTMFSAAGSRAGTVITNILGAGVHDMFAGRQTRAQRRREMAHALRQSKWLAGGPATQMDASTWRRKRQQAWKRQLLARAKSRRLRQKALAFAAPGQHLTRDQRSARIWKAVRSASLVIEPARFIAAAPPEWITLEQVPEVLPLWKVYAGELRARGYSVWCGILNAADYGVPQTRERAILIASRVRTVRRPTPTHYNPAKGMQLWGTPWVSMAEALGFGATGRPGPAVTAGGTATGGAEPLARGGREALERERDAGRWVVRPGAGGFAEGYERSVDEPSPTVRLQTTSWHLQIDAQKNATCRPVHAPAGTIKSGHSMGEMRWVLQRQRGAGMLERGGPRRDHPIDEPAPTINAGETGMPRFLWKFRNNNNNNACERSPDEPAGTLFFGSRSNWAAFTDGQDSVRISPQEAAVLQSFPVDYPWQGAKGKVFEQIGNAVPPRLAMAIVGEATGIAWQALAAEFYGDVEAAA